MEKGYNSDIQYSGKSFHVQTEDWGADNPYLVTKIFLNGAVIKSFKTHYSKFLVKNSSAPLDVSVRAALKLQHKKILDLVQTGQLFKP